MDTKFFTILNLLNQKQIKNDLESGNPWQSDTLAYDIEKVDEDIGQSCLDIPISIDYSHKTNPTNTTPEPITYNNTSHYKINTSLEVDENDTARNSLTHLRIPTPSIKSSSTLSPSDRQIRHSKIALNNITKVFEKIVKERDEKGLEMEMIETKLSSLEFDLGNVNVLIEKYTSLKNELVSGIESGRTRKVKLEEDINDLDSRLALISTETTGIESLVQSLNPVEQVHRTTFLNVFFGHERSVEAVDFGNGRMVTGSADRTCRVWDVEGRRCIGVLDGHDGWIRDIQVEGFMVVSGSGDHTAKLWDISLLNDPQTIDKPSSPQQSLDNLNVNADKDCLIKTFYGHAGGINCLQFESGTLLTGSNDKTIKTWDMETGGNTSTLSDFDSDEFSSSTNTLSPLSEEGKSHIGSLHFYQHALAAGFGDGIVRLFDLRTLKCHRSLQGHLGTVTGLMFDDFEIITGSMDKSLRVLVRLIDTPGNITKLSIDHSRIAVACGLKDIKVYSRLTGEGETIVGHGKVVRAVKLDGGRLLSGGYDCTVRLWALAGPTFNQ